MYGTDTLERVFNNADLLKYQVTAQYEHILNTSANPMRYKRLAKMIRQLAAIEHCTTADILAELRDDNVEYN